MGAMLHCVETNRLEHVAEAGGISFVVGPGSAPITARMNRRFGPAVTQTIGTLEVVPMSNDLTVAFRLSDQNSDKTLFFLRTLRSARLLL